MVRDHSVEKYVNPSMRVEYKEGQPVRIKYIMPDQEIFESLAARTRPCILASEPIYLDKVFSSINSLLNGRQLDEKSSDLLNACRTGFENLRDKNGGTSYSVQIYDKDGSPESEAMSDLLVGDGWLYSDLVHANPKGDKAEAARLPYLDRYFAGTSFFSTLAIVIVQTLKLVTDLNGRFGLGIDERAWKEQVVLTDGEDDGIVSQKMVLLPYDTKLLEGVDPSTLPGAVDATSLTEIQRVIQPNSAAEAVFLHGEETIGEFHAIHSWKTGTNSARRRALHKNVGIKPFPAYISSIRHFETREFLTKNRLIRHNWSGNSSGKAPPPQPGDVSWSGSSARSSSSQARPIRNG